MLKNNYGVICGLIGLFGWVQFVEAGPRSPVLDLSEILALRVDVANSTNNVPRGVSEPCEFCNGEGCDVCQPSGPWDDNPTPIGLSDFLITQSAVLKGGETGVSYCFEVTVEGRVESQDAGYDIVYLNGERLFSSLDLKDGSMVTLQAKRTISLKPGESITLGYDTRDDRYHTGAYAKISEILPLQGCANNTCQPGNAKVRLGSVNFAVSAGTRSDGKSAGEMWVDEHYPKGQKGRT